MTNLILHCGASAVSAVDVRGIQTPMATDTHFPIPHAELVEVVLNSVRGDFGYELVNQAHGMTHDGARYFGLFEVAGLANDYAPIIGLRNSHDMAFAAGLVIGSQVFVCDNLAFSGDIKIARKHTRNIMRDLPLMVGRAVERLGNMQKHMDLRIDAYKSTDFTDEQRDHVLLEAARNNALSWSNLGKVNAELLNPTHSADEFGVREDSAWNLFNACTEVLKTRSSNGPDPRWTQFLHRVFDKAVDLGEFDPMDGLEVEDAEWSEVA